MAKDFQNYGEYQDSAPEPIAQSQPIGSSSPDGGLGSQPGILVEGKHKKKVLGLAPWMAFTLIFIALLIVVSIIIGAVLGTKFENHGGQLPTLDY